VTNAGEQMCTLTLTEGLVSRGTSSMTRPHRYLLIAALIAVLLGWLCLAAVLLTQ